MQETFKKLKLFGYDLGNLTTFIGKGWFASLGGSLLKNLAFMSGTGDESLDAEIGCCG